MKAYVVAHLWNVNMNEEIKKYLHRIDETLRPFGGYFIIHGGVPTILEGKWTGDLIVVEFPNQQNANDWYHSPEYQKIAKLRSQNSEGRIFIYHGVDPDHKAREILN